MDLDPSTWRIIALQNPWWSDPSRIHEDQHLLGLQGRSYYFHNPLAANLALTKGDFHLIRGPRQVGKTTLAKELIRRAIVSGHVDPRQILYLSCEIWESHGEIEKVLVEWLESRSLELNLVVLDEISFVKEWQRAILYAFNAGLFRNTCLFVTGSNARDLKDSSERFPGRRGQGRDISLFPLAPHELGTLECFEGLSERDLLETYLKVGGFPPAIRDYVESGFVTDRTFETYKNWIVGDAARFGMSGEILRHVYARVFETLASRITWPRLIESTPVKSHETALKYVEHLEDALLCKVHFCYDERRGGPAENKARKLYFIDPLLYYLGHSWKRGFTNVWSSVLDLHANPQFRGGLLESVYVTCTSRYRWPTYFWYSTKTQKEADLVLEGHDSLLVFDLKASRTRARRVLDRAVSVLGPDECIAFLRSAGEQEPR